MSKCLPRKRETSERAPRRETLPAELSLTEKKCNHRRSAKTGQHEEEKPFCGTVSIEPKLKDMYFFLGSLKESGDRDSNLLAVNSRETCGWSDILVLGKPPPPPWQHGACPTESQSLGTGHSRVEFRRRQRAPSLRTAPENVAWTVGGGRIGNLRFPPHGTAGMAMHLALGTRGH